jgi:hypothetical protein
MTDDTTEKRLEAIAARFNLDYSTVVGLYTASSSSEDLHLTSDKEVAASPERLEAWLCAAQAECESQPYNLETFCRRVLGAISPRPPIDYSELEMKVAALFNLQAKAAEEAALSLRAHEFGRRDSTPWQVKKAGRRWKR